MDWLHPTYAWALLLVPAAVWLYWRAARWRRAALERFGEATVVRQLAPSRWLSGPRRRIVKAGFVGGALLLGALSLMGPRFGTTVRTVERQGVDLVVALDVSASMRARDVPPSRLRRAKNEIRDLLGTLSGDRVGLVLFAGEGVVQCPLTTDYEALRLFLEGAGPSQVPVPGTRMGAAVDAALRAFDAGRALPDSSRAPPPGQGRPRALLLVSDGENHVGDLDAVRQKAKEAGVTLLTAGVGTEKGARVPEYKGGTRVGYKRNRQGEVVRSRLNEEALMRLAKSGAYFRIGGTTSALSDVPAALEQLGTATYGAEPFAEYDEMYQWPLAAALLLLFVESLIPVRARARTARTVWTRLGLARESE